MARALTLSWLLPANAAEIARLTRLVAWRPAELGVVDWTAALGEAEATGRNLSLGLFEGRRLRAFLLAFIDHATRPSIEDGSGIRALGTPIVHVAMFGTHSPAHAARFFQALARTLNDRPGLRDARLEARLPGSTLAAMLASESSPVRLASDASARDGCSEHKPDVADAMLVTPTRLEFRPVAPPVGPSFDLAATLDDLRTYELDGERYQVGVCSSPAQWDGLDPYWDELLAKTAGGNATQTLDYLRAWWRHLGAPDGLFIVVVLRRGTPAAIAPFQRITIVTGPAMTRLLEFVGMDQEIDKPVVMHADAKSVRVMARYLLERRADWDRIRLREQSATDDCSQAWREEFLAAGYLVAQAVGPSSPIVDLATGWPAYLQSRPRELRRNLKRRHRQLAEIGIPRLASLRGRDSAAALQQYVSVESASWKAAVPELSLHASPRRLAFFRELVSRPLAAELRFGFLTVDDAVTAGTFGLLWRRRYSSLHICHDRSWADYSPGVQLTALELEELMARGECDVCDFMCGFETGKLSWATSVLETRHLVIERATAMRRLHHCIEFRMRPRIKAWLVRARLQPLALRLKQKLRRRFVRHGA
jgi:CelD/BcsL family acetyltransferase involved in cellulose biosynthesis